MVTISRTIPRAADQTLASLAAGYPVVAVTGPRQSGKTTLVRAAFPSHAYASLENPAQREFAESDPAGFLRTFDEGVILDEVQSCPRLFGLAAWLLGIESARQLSTHPLRGPLFETWVVGEFLKRRLNAGRPSNLSFWRDRSGHEVDLLVESPQGIQPVEIKATATPTADCLRGLDQLRGMIGQAGPRPCLVYGGDMPQRRSESDIVPWRTI